MIHRKAIFLVDYRENFITYISHTLKDLRKPSSVSTVIMVSFLKEQDKRLQTLDSRLYIHFVQNDVSSHGFRYLHFPNILYAHINNKEHI